MILKTKIDVTYNQGVTGTATGIVQGQLLSAGWIDETFTKIGANYIYADANGNQIEKNGFVIEGDEIQNLYDSVIGFVPEGLDYKSTQQYLYNLGFMSVMAQTFGIETTDIEIVQ